jgi:hypothetical protein
MFTKNIKFIIIAMAVVFTVSFGLVFADTNGVWHNAKDVRSGVFANDETAGSFTFINNTLFITNMSSGSPALNIDKVNASYGLYIENLNNSGSGGVGIVGYGITGILGSGVYGVFGASSSPNGAAGYFNGTDAEYGLEVYGNVSIDGTIFVNGEEFTGGSKYVGYTSSKFDGNLGGYVSANDVCRAEYPGSHVCSAHEIIYSISDEKSFDLFEDIFLWINTGGPKYAPAPIPVDDCRGWTSSLSQTGALGSIWKMDATTGGIGAVVGCNNQQNIACCK